MKIRLKTVCPEQLGRLPDGEYEVADGSTAQQALCACMEAAGLRPASAETLSQLVWLRNSSPTRPGAPLSEGDRLIVLRPLTGG